MKMPDELTIKERGCTMDMSNDRGSDRTCDLYVEKTDVAFFITLSTTNGSLEVRTGKEEDNKRVILSEYQVESLVRFLQQKD